MTKKMHSKESSKIRRRHARISQALLFHRGHYYHPKSRMGSNFSNVPSIKTTANLSDLPHAKGSYTGKRDNKKDQDQHIWTTDEPFRDGFRVIEWEGLYVSFISTFETVV